MVDIRDLFNEDELSETNDSNIYKTKVCPSCGQEGYGGFVLFLETNTSYCHSSRKWFTLLETYMLINGNLRCIEGREKVVYKNE